MPRRKEVLAIGEVYHVFSKSIAGFNIFYESSQYLRMVEGIRFYQQEKPPCKFSRYLRAKIKNSREVYDVDYLSSSNSARLVDIIAYCIMPTHVHLILMQLVTDGISEFMRKLLLSYTCYFNTKHHRKGPLWETRFKNVSVKSDEQLLHLTRYVHLNPVTAYLVDSPGEWHASSYSEYVSDKVTNKICRFDQVLEIEPNSYSKFVEDGVSYQRELARLKKSVAMSRPGVDTGSRPGVEMGLKI